MLYALEINNNHGKDPWTSFYCVLIGIIMSGSKKHAQITESVGWMPALYELLMRTHLWRWL